MEKLGTIRLAGLLSKKIFKTIILLVPCRRILPTCSIPRESDVVYLKKARPAADDGPLPPPPLLPAAAEASAPLRAVLSSYWALERRASGPWPDKTWQKSVRQTERKRERERERKKKKSIFFILFIFLNKSKKREGDELTFLMDCFPLHILQTHWRFLVTWFTQNMEHWKHCRTKNSRPIFSLLFVAKPNIWRGRSFKLFELQTKKNFFFFFILF